MPERTYALYGPLRIPRTGDRKRIATKRLNEFWDCDADEVAVARGCYIFGIRSAAGTKPWYVGKTRRTFRQECFTDRNQLRFNEVLAERKGTPVLFLLARMTPTGRFGTPTPQEADWVEQMLIHHCLYANGELLNVHGARLATEVVIPGLHNSPPGRPSEEARALKLLLSLG